MAINACSFEYCLLDGNLFVAQSSDGSIESLWRLCCFTDLSCATDVVFWDERADYLRI